MGIVVIVSVCQNEYFMHLKCWPYFDFSTGVTPKPLLLQKKETKKETQYHNVAKNAVLNHNS